MKRSRIIWTLPLTALALGALAIWATREEQTRVTTDLERSFQAHVDSVARLVREGTREASTTVDQIYALSEHHLDTTLRLLALLPALSRLPNIEAEQITVWLRLSADGQILDALGEQRLAATPDVIAQVLAADPGELVELHQHDLYCVHVDIDDTTWIGCRDVEELRRLRREVGLGPLLAEVAQSGVRYVVIQDQHAVLASTPGAAPQAQPLPEVPPGSTLEESRPSYRELTWNGASLVEGLWPFPLPDGSQAVLRVGVDAAPLVALRREMLGRQRWFVGVVGLAVLLATLLAWGLGRWQRQRLASERAMAEQAEQQRHWQTIGQMAATVAHEVRNPLNTVQMAATRLQREFVVSESEQAEYTELLDTLRAEAERVGHVVTDFLELGRPLQLRLESMSVRNLFDSVVQALGVRAAQEHKRLEIEVTGELTVHGDRRRLVQLLQNLVGNALDASEPGSRVLLRATAPTAQHIALHVVDQGAGMDATQLTQALEPFVTSRARGVGLGLPLAQRLAEAHGGTLRLESSPGAGTRAIVTLAAADSPRQQEPTS